MTNQLGRSAEETAIHKLLSWQQNSVFSSKNFLFTFQSEQTTNFALYMHYHYLLLVVNALAETRSHLRRNPWNFDRRS